MNGKAKTGSEHDMAKLNILFIGALPPPHIGPTLATEIILASSLTERHHLVHLDTSDHRPMTTLSAIDLTNIVVAVKSYLRMIGHMLRGNIDVVYVPISQTTIGYLKDSVYILIAKVFRKKVVTHLRGGNFRNWLGGASFLTRYYVRVVHRLVDTQIVLGENLRVLFKDILPDSRICVVPNGRDFPYTVKRVQSSVVRYLFLSNVRKEKGVMDFLKAGVMLASKRSDVQFIVAGAMGARSAETVGIEISDLLKQHPNLPVQFVGKVDEHTKQGVLSNADVFVFPSYYQMEGHPWVIVEAMAASLPIVSCDQGCIIESVIDGDNGFIVPKHDPGSLMEAMLRFADDSDIRKRMGDRSRIIYEEQFTESVMVHRLNRAFENAA